MQAAVDGHRLANRALFVMASGAVDRSTSSNPRRAKYGAADVVGSPPSRHAPRWVPWTVGGLFVVAVTAGAWGGAWIAVDGSSACGSMPKARCDSLYDTRTPGLILVSGGVAAAAAGITLWLMNR